MPYIRDRAIVLKREPFREQDRRYVLYGQEQGLLIAVARGSSLRTSKQAGHLEPFSCVDVMVARGALFDTLAVARNVGPAPMARGILSRYAVLGSFMHIALALLRPGMSDRSVFEMMHELRDVCDLLKQELTSERARALLAAANVRLLDALGFAPNIEEATGLSVECRTLLKCFRRFSFSDVLRVTASVEVLSDASAYVEAAMTAAPLTQAPHGPVTIRTLLADAITT